MWRRTIAILLLDCAASLSQLTDASPARPTLSTNNLCFVDGLKYSTVESALSACGRTGIVVIPPAYAGTGPVKNLNGIRVWDFRHSQRPEGFSSVTDFGAKGDAATGADGATEMGSTTFTAASGSFTSGRDEGKVIIITGAGTDNKSLTTTIKAVNSSNRVTLAVATGFTATGLTFWYGTENTPAFQAAYHSRKPLFLPAGEFLMTGAVKGPAPLVLTGSGEQSTIIDDGTAFHVQGGDGVLLNNFRMQAATKLTPVAPKEFPTPHAGTPVALDRIGDGIGYQPKAEDVDVWPKVSKQQQLQQIGPTILASSNATRHQDAPASPASSIVTLCMQARTSTTRPT